jgi:Raf kinase inhibitor-like YbhB/YbcL family protein
MLGILSRSPVATATLALALVLALTPAARAAGFAVTSPGLTDGGPLPVSGAQPNCGGGQSVSPALVWTNVPSGVASFAIVLYDPDANFVHWVAYGIPSGATSVAAGFGTQSPLAYTGGANGVGMPMFFGYCPPAGDTPHHYTFTVYATDLAPGALAPGLTRDALLAALQGHVKARQSFVGRYGR